MIKFEICTILMLKSSMRREFGMMMYRNEKENKEGELLLGESTYNEWMIGDQE